MHTVYRGITGCCRGHLPRTATAREEGAGASKESRSILFSEQPARLWGFRSTSSTPATTPCFWLGAYMLDIFFFMEYCEFLLQFSFPLAERRTILGTLVPCAGWEFQSLWAVLQTEGRALDQELGTVGGPGAADLQRGPGRPPLASLSSGCRRLET